MTVISSSLMQKALHIEIAMKKRVDNLLSGGYRSRFKGTGVQFAEHRVYVPGDDVRRLDWKVSARSKEPLIKMYEEERELQVFLVVDLSSSEMFGSREKSKQEVLAEVAALLALAAQRAGDRVGILIFANEKQKILRPKRGRQQVLRLIREVLAFEPDTGGTQLQSALEATDRILKHSGVVFVLSDFLTQGYEIALRRLQRRHEVLACWVQDPLEVSLPLSGAWLVEDPETGFKKWLMPRSKMDRAQMVQKWNQHAERTALALRQSRVDHLEMKTQDPYVDILVSFFKKRSLRRH